jgi:hypothetical protein
MKRTLSTMGRPPLDLGTHGRFRTYRAGTVWRSRCYVRDYEGVVRECERTGRSAAAAERALGKALRDRARVDADVDITAETRLVAVAEAWFADFQRKDRSPRHSRLTEIASTSKSSQVWATYGCVSSR